jgi:hypothetical protein
MNSEWDRRDAYPTRLADEYKTGQAGRLSYERLMMRACMRVTWIVWAFGLVVMAACSQEEKMHRVSGNVTFAGKPIPKGLIFFDPQVDGPQGFANIENGKYDTAIPGKGRGIRGGAYNIRVGGFTGIEKNEAPFGDALFPEYNSTKDLPKADSTYDVDVPKK